MTSDQYLIDTYSEFTKVIFRSTDYDSVEFIGSGSILRLDGKLYLFTAGHVLDQATAGRPLFLGVSGRLIPIVGTALTSHTNIPGYRGDDQIDFAVLELPDTQNELFDGTSFLVLSHLDIGAIAIPQLGFLFMGYPESKNRTTISKSTREINPFLYAARCGEADLNAYEALHVMRSENLVLKFDWKRVLSRSGGRRLAPALNGLSGAPIWGRAPDGTALVVAVLTAHHKRERSIVSTRISRFYSALLQLQSATHAAK